MMSNLELIEKLCGMLNEAQEIIRAQAQLMEMHGIKTDSGDLESQRTKLLEEIENSI